MPATLALAALLALLAWTAVAFNRLIRHRNLVREAWSGIDVQLKRRHDLVPALVEATRGHAHFERGTLESLTRLRGERASRAQQDGENALSGQLREILAVVEAYPELRASQSFLDLQTRLAEVENQLQMARRYYNGTVRDYNIAVESFPSNLIARAGGFPVDEFFQVESATERAAPQVSL
ncbi:MAG: LemA family protein [Deltaproteobacteria bacterium]|nr:LemA family protein [Deltaproteobacteria bacterium]